MSNYAQGHTPAVLQSHSLRTAQNTCHYFLPHLQPHFHILDVGCGPGSITASLATLIPSGQITGLDSGPDAIRAASAQPSLPQNTRFQTGDAMNLPFEDATFDVVHTSQVLCHLPDPVSALREFRRVLKPGGFVACREADAGSIVVHPLTEGMQLWWRAQEGIQRVASAQPRAGRQLIDWALQAGFSGKKMRYGCGTMTYAAVEREWFGEMMAKRVKEDGKWRENAVKSGAVREEELEGVVRAWREWSADERGVWSVLCGEVVAFV